MPFITYAERHGLEKGLEKGLKLGIAVNLRARFGPAAEAVLVRMEQIHDVALLQQILERTPSFATIEEILALLPPTNGQ